MAKKTAKTEIVEAGARPGDPNAYNHLTPEERFLLFVARAMGSARAAKCIKLDVKAVNAEWSKFSEQSLPINLS